PRASTRTRPSSSTSRRSSTSIRPTSRCSRSRSCGACSSSRASPAGRISRSAWTGPTRAASSCTSAARISSRRERRTRAPDLTAFVGAGRAPALTWPRRARLPGGSRRLCRLAACGSRGRAAAPAGLALRSGAGARRPFLGPSRPPLLTTRVGGRLRLAQLLDLLVEAGRGELGCLREQLERVPVELDVEAIGSFGDLLDVLRDVLRARSSRVDPVLAAELVALDAEPLQQDDERLVDPLDEPDDREACSEVLLRQLEHLLRDVAERPRQAAEHPRVQVVRNVLDAGEALLERHVRDRLELVRLTPGATAGPRELDLPEVVRERALDGVAEEGDVADLPVVRHERVNGDRRVAVEEARIGVLADLLHDLFVLGLERDAAAALEDVRGVPGLRLRRPQQPGDGRSGSLRHVHEEQELPRRRAVGGAGRSRLAIRAAAAPAWPAGDLLRACRPAGAARLAPNLLGVVRRVRLPLEMAGEIGLEARIGQLRQ